MKRLAIAVLRGAAYALTAGIGFAGGCSLTTLDFVGCRSDADCAVSVGDDHLCSADGFCRKAPELPGRCDGDLEVRLIADLSGPNADVGVSYFKGQLDLIRQLNEEGGIRGCPIIVRAVDAESDEDMVEEALAHLDGRVDVGRRDHRVHDRDRRVAARGARPRHPGNRRRDQQRGRGAGVSRRAGPADRRAVGQ